MAYAGVSRVLARFFLYLAAILALPTAVSFVYEFFLDKIYFKTPATFAFLETIALCLIFSLLFRYFGRNATKDLHRRESILLVALIWFITAGIGSLPFVFTDTLSNPIDAYFESMSGLTTTGATILEPKVYNSFGKEIINHVANPVDPAIIYTFYGTIAPLKDPATGATLATGVEALGKPLLFWRAFLQWLGGMGIVLLFIAVLPTLAMGGKFLYESEVTGPSKEALTPRIKETASFLWKVYLGLTLIQITLLILTNPQMPFFDAVCLSFSTLSTGGFSVRNDGLASYDHLSTQWIIVIFMLLGSINFSLYFHILRGKIYRLYEPEFFIYILSLTLVCGLMTWNLTQASFYPFSKALVIGSFQAISTQTSTGFTLTNYDFWPFGSQFLMIILMYIGGMSGSTSGGIKIIRYTILLRLIKNKIESLFRPEAVRCLKIGEKEISDKTSTTVLIFFCVVVSLVIFGSYLLVLDSNDPTTALGTISCMINNIGISFGGIGGAGSFAFLSNFSKIISILWMALGRLEYFVLLVLLVPAFWRKR